MWRRRQFFAAVFFFGTMIAAIGWIGELRDWPMLVIKFFKFGNLAIAGHVLQIVGAFGSLLTPDYEKVVDDQRNDFDNDL